MCLYVRERSMPAHNNGMDSPKERYLPDGTIVRHGRHDRLAQIFGSPHIGGILRSEFAAREGKMMVSGKALHAFEKLA